MKDVRYNEETRYFLCCSEIDSNIEYSFEYNQKYSSDIDISRYEVQLLINPYLNRESNIFRLKDGHGAIGYVFPITVLDSDEDLDEQYRDFHKYVYAAYTVLLRRLPRITDTSCLSANFEDNICVFMLNKRITRDGNDISSCIHSLRKRGYSYFIDNNKITSVNYYDPLRYCSQTCIRLIFSNPPLYNHFTIRYLLEEYPKAASSIHRFVLLYQIIEFLFDMDAKTEASEIINKFNSNQISYNDFSTDLRALTSEKTKINNIFGKCGSLSNMSNFNQSYTDLCNCIPYHPNCNSDAERFYSFRNLLTHSYRLPHQHEQELNRTIQDAELLILEIVEKYPA